ncbi:glycosyltransferase family 4 protein [Roseibium sp. RKSG952]|uniref:glycosyltransferase family 4 protein n=1 Tax=Roseibium sp. RKSG952 TaxID=2529384 RepID=UPI0012BCF494|nr:glycosyltransferase family 4 protein [Roseibium sp. RKSG952]MTH98965.1 glycosyltransferase [Roseibium sp. RKSG952]
MKIAFTAPMKPLDHPVPSGDRTMGRLIVAALQSAGHDVSIASTFRAWAGQGGEEIQREIRDAAWTEADRIAAAWEASGDRPDVFLTYHLYHKAPDWIGPHLADRFGLPYAIIEASRAPKRQSGPWAFGFREADKALKRADMVAALHNADAGCLAPVLGPDHLTVLPPFIDTTAFDRAAALPKPLPAPPLKLLAVGMMRTGDKTRSYEVLAGALDHVRDRPWRLTIVGDGENSSHVLSLFPADRINWLGARPLEDLPGIYAAHDLLVWPAIREAFGLAFLEAQAAGLAAVGGATFGVPDIVKHGETGLLSAEGDALAFSQNLLQFLENPMLAETFGQAARRHIAQTHTLHAGARRLVDFLQSAVANYTNR